MQGELVVTTTDDEYSQPLAGGLPSRTTGRVISKKTGVVGVEFVCVWRPTA